MAAHLEEQQELDNFKYFWKTTGRWLFALLMAAASSLMMTLTHYATGSSPVIYGSGYTTLGEWWKAGFAMSVLNLLVFTLIGGVWWKALGYW